jgi:hypothetical protein
MLGLLTFATDQTVGRTDFVSVNHKWSKGKSES